jgi:uroporphyrinogen decarboxylase
MTPRELVIEALEHRETPVIPHHIDFTRRAMDQLISYTGDPDIEKKLGACLNYIQYWGWPEELKENPGRFRDEFGVVWNRSGPDKDIGVVENPQIADLEDTGYRLPVCNKARLRKEYEELIAAKGDRFTMAGFGFCMFERSWSLMGMENVLVSMITCPDALDALYDRLCGYYLELLDIALEYDIDGVYFGDDWGQQQGLIMGPDHWRHFIKPRMARLYKRVKAAGKYALQHSCGDCREIFPDLIEIGLDCYQTFQPEIYDIKKMKELYGDKLCFWGGVSTQQCLPHTDAVGVKKETVRVMRTLRRNGGLIIAPTHALPYDIPPENILAMADVFQNQDNYLSED